MFSSINVFCVLVAISVCASLPRMYFRDYDSVVIEADLFVCSVPQPRAVSVSSLTGETTDIYDPPYVVLHRCGQSGCCPSEEQSCRPDKTVTVELEVKTWMDEPLIIRAKNHTSCACLDTAGPIK